MFSKSVTKTLWMLKKLFAYWAKFHPDATTFLNRDSKYEDNCCDTNVGWLRFENINQKGKKKKESKIWKSKLKS